MWSQRLSPDVASASVSADACGSSVDACGACVDLDACRALLHWVTFSMVDATLVCVCVRVPVATVTGF
jgi:hypothetical protein